MSDHLSQSTCLEMLHPKTDEHVNPSVEFHHIVAKLFTAKTLLTEVQREDCNVYNQGKTLCSPCIVVYLAYRHSLRNYLQHLRFVSLT